MSEEITLERVQELIAASVGVPFQAGKKSPMRQWLVVTEETPGLWESLAEEAYAFTATEGSRDKA